MISRKTFTQGITKHYPAKIKHRNVFLIICITLETHLGIYPDHNLCCSQNVFPESLLVHAFVCTEFYIMVMSVLNVLDWERAALAENPLEWMLGKG